MNRTATVTLAVALAVALAAMPLGAAGVSTDEQATDGDESIQPGERFAGVVAVQEAEVNGEVTERTYGVKLAKAQTDEAKADVVGEQLADVEERLDELEGRLDELEDAREAGEISEGEYRARVATVEAEKASVERTAESANETASELPEEVLEERGINVTAIEELRERADELSGPEVAEIARSIAGDAVGQSPAVDRQPGAPIETPDGDEPGNVTDQGDAPEETPDQEEEDDGPNETPDDEGDDAPNESPDDGDDATDDRSSDQ